MINTVANRVASLGRGLPNKLVMLNSSFQTIPSWLRLRNSKWKTISTVICFDLQSHRPHSILLFYSQVLKPELWSWIRHICSLALMALDIVSLLYWQNYLKHLGASFFICKDISLWIKLLLLLKNTAKIITREVIPSTTAPFIFYCGALLQFESCELAA